MVRFYHQSYAELRRMPPLAYMAFQRLIPRLMAIEERTRKLGDNADPRQLDTYLSYLATGGDPEKYGAVVERGHRAVAKFREAVELAQKPRRKRQR